MDSSPRLFTGELHLTIWEKLVVSASTTGSVRTQSHCSSDVALLSEKSRPLYLLKEFPAVFVLTVYFLAQSRNVILSAHRKLLTRYCVHYHWCFQSPSQWTSPKILLRCVRYLQKTNTFNHIYCSVKRQCLACTSDHISFFMYLIHKHILNQTVLVCKSVKGLREGASGLL